jgi:hypothetical protein
MPSGGRLAAVSWPTRAPDPTGIEIKLIKKDGVGVDDPDVVRLDRRLAAS